MSRVQYSVPEESPEYCIIFGPTTKLILERYTALTGRPALPPKWTFGLQLSISLAVMRLINEMSERRIPPAVFLYRSTGNR